MANRKFWRWFEAVAICGIVVSAWSAADRADSPTTSVSDKQGHLPPSLVTVHRGDLKLDLDFKGVFEPGASAEIRIDPRSYHDDFIVEHAVAPGTRVSRGQVILEFESDKIDAQIAAADNALRIARANLEKAEADIRLGQKADAQSMSAAKQQLVDAQTELARWDTIDSPIALLSRSMQARISDFEVENDADELNELKKMYKSEDLTNETADIVMKRAIRILGLETQMSKIAHAGSDRFADFEAGVQREQLADTVDQQTISLAQLNASQVQGLALRQTSLVTAQAALDDARRNLDLLRRDRGLFSISAPMDGIVVYGSFEQKTWHSEDQDHFQPGQKLSSGQVLMTLYRPGRLRLAIECPEEQLGYFSAGAKVRVTPQSLPQISYDGLCETPSVFGQASGKTQTFDIPVDLPSVDPRLAPGYSADVDYDAGSRDNVLLVPVSAVWRNKVWIMKPGSSTAEPVSVVIGASDGQNMQIVSGLSEGDVIVTQSTPPAEP